MKSLTKFAKEKLVNAAPLSQMIKTLTLKFHHVHEKLLKGRNVKSTSERHGIEVKPVKYLK